MCRCRTSLIRGTKKGHGKISWPNPIGKHIQVLQQNQGYFCRACGEAARRFMTQHVTSHRPITALRRDYSITSSARTSSDDGTSRPSAFAVLRLITSSNVAGCMTGRSAAFVPFRIRLA
jgi:hypothetical protein